MEPFVGESGASYTPDGKQREGGFATVWRCTGAAGRVAVKWTKAGPDSDRWYLRERGFLERLTAASDSARFVVPLLDAGRHDGRGFLVLPWIPKDLTGWVADGPDRPQRVDVARQVCDAVAGLHASGIGFKERLVHRDVKPHNLADARATRRLLELTGWEERGLQPTQTRIARSRALARTARRSVVDGARGAEVPFLVRNLARAEFPRGDDARLCLPRCGRSRAVGRRARPQRARRPEQRAHGGQHGGQGLGPLRWSGGWTWAGRGGCWSSRWSTCFDERAGDRITSA